MPRQLEIKCGCYILQIVKPMLDNFELIKQQIDKNDAQIEIKATQLSELDKQYNKLYSDMETKEIKISELEGVKNKLLNEINNKNDQYIKFQIEVNEWKETQSRKLEETQNSHKNEIGDKNNQIKILKETLTSLQIENSIYKTKVDIVNKDSQTKKLEEKITNLQIENTVYKTKEDSMAVVLKEIRSQMETVIAEQITNKLCEDQNNQIELLSTQINSHARIEEEYERQLENRNNQIKKLSKELQVKEVKSCVTFADSPGVHTISLSKFDTFKVLCNSDIAGPGWTVIQQKNSDFNFNQNWTTFKNGFGKISNEGNFFLGLEKIHKLTVNHDHELYILMETSNSTFYAGYESFAIAGEQDHYRLHLGRHLEGDDILGEHDKMRFSTYDNDNDKKCASNLHSGWWYNDCGNW